MACALARRARSRSPAHRPGTRGRRLASEIACGSASLLRLPAPCTSAGARTALYNWLLAQQAPENRSSCASKIRTASARPPRTSSRSSTPCGWLDLDWDEGPIFQSDRADRHREVLAQLLESGHAYRSTATAEDVKAYKQQHGSDRGFRGDARGRPAPSACASPTRAPPSSVTSSAADTAFEHVHLDDPVIARADGSVLYNFAVAVDDLDAGITDVVRGEDHLSNSPKQLLVFEALGVEPPRYAHLPLLHGPDGKKLSKRHGAASVQELRDAGYLPEAVRNYIALLGWGYDDETTLLSTEQMIEGFRLERVTRNPAVFDEQKLRWMNGRYLRELPLDELTRTARAVHRPHRDRGRRGHRAGQDADAGRLRAAVRVHLRRPRRRPRGVRQGHRQGRRGREPRRRPRRAGRRRALRPGARRDRAARRGRGARGQAAPGLPAAARGAGRQHGLARASSRPSPCSAATRPCAGSTRRSRRRLPRRTNHPQIRGIAGCASKPGLAGCRYTGRVEPIAADACPKPRERCRDRGAHNEGHGRRLTAAFEALEAFPAAGRVPQPRAAPARGGADVGRGRLVAAVETDVALAISVLRLANQVEGARRGRSTTWSRRSSCSRPRPCRPSPAARAPSTSSSAPACGRPRPSASACTPSPPSTPPTGSRPSVGYEHRDRLMVTALLHDVGKLVLVHAYPGYPAQVHGDARTPEERMRRERRELGVDHALVGGVLARRWGLPTSIASTIERHHAEDADGEAAFVRLADMLAHYAQGAAVSPAELLRTARTIGIGAGELRARHVRPALPDRRTPAPRSTRARSRTASSTCSGAWPRARSTSRSRTS